MKKRKLALLNTLADEITKTSYQDVSVTIVCDIVGCSRQNFYYYFDSIDDALKALVDLDVASVDINVIQPSSFKCILSVIWKRKEFYSTMFKDPLSRALINEILIAKLTDLYNTWGRYTIREYSRWSDENKKDYFGQIAWSNYSLIYNWILSDYADPLDVIEKKAINYSKEIADALVNDFSQKIGI